MVVMYEDMPEGIKDKANEWIKAILDKLPDKTGVDTDLGGAIYWQTHKLCEVKQGRQGLYIVVQNPDPDAPMPARTFKPRKGQIDTGDAARVVAQGIAYLEEQKAWLDQVRSAGEVSRAAIRGLTGGIHGIGGLSMRAESWYADSGELLPAVALRLTVRAEDLEKVAEAVLPFALTSQKS